MRLLLSRQKERKKRRKLNFRPGQLQYKAAENLQFPVFSCPCTETREWHRRSACGSQYTFKRGTLCQPQLVSILSFNLRVTPLSFTVSYLRLVVF